MNWRIALSSNVCLGMVLVTGCPYINIKTHSVLDFIFERLGLVTKKKKNLLSGVVFDREVALYQVLRD